MHIRKKLIWSAMFATATMALTGCIGGSSSSGTTSSSGVTLSGAVADGYLGNATVCLDINQNKVCDPSEPSSKTVDDGTGSYSLNATQAQIDSAPILVIVTTSTTDTDLGGGTVSRAYTLSAPAGKSEFISPISTMIQAKIELNPTMTPEQAQISVKGDLGLTNPDSVDLYKDFIKEGETGNDDYKVLHQTAQVVARAIADFTEKLTALNLNLGADNITIKDIQKMVAEDIMSQLPAIHAAAEAHIDGGGAVDPDYADTHVRDSVDKTGITSLTKEDVNRKKSEYQLTENTTVTSIMDAIGTDGLAFMSYKLKADGESGVYVSVIKVEGSVTNMYQSYESFFTDWLDNHSSDQDVKDDTSGVHAELYKSSVMTTGANGNASFIGNDGERIDIHKFAKVSLSGVTKNLKDIVGESSDYQGTDKVTFLEGDIGYQFSYTATPLIHSLNLDNQTFTDMCGTIVNGYSNDCFITGRYDVFDPITGVPSARLFSDLYADLGLFDGVEADNESLYEIKNGTVYQCKSEIKALNGFPTCKDGLSLEALGTIKKGTFADRVDYILIPRAEVKDNGQVRMRYRLLTTDNADKIIQRDRFIEKDGTLSIGVREFYSLSAIKRIHAAAPQPQLEQ